MPSLKRTRSGSQDSSRTQKRSCSNPMYESPAELTQYAVPDDSYMSEASEPSSEPFPQHVPGLCIHKQANACSLWMELCCACADKRPISMRYLAYIDGDGYTASQYRAANYCDGCRAAWVSPGTANVPESECSNSNATELNVRKRKSSDSVEPGSIDPNWTSLESIQPEITPGTIRVTCVNRTFHVVRKEYMTFDELRQQVAQLLRCDPRELIAMASDIDMKLRTEDSDYGLAAFSYNASRIHFRICRTEDVEMDGA